MENNFNIRFYQFGIKNIVLQILETLGIIPGEDMTVEAALTKLTFVLGIPGLTFQERVNVSIYNEMNTRNYYHLKYFNKLFNICSHKC